jgi:hypothetical protein
MTANDRNGLRLSRADRRANVEWLLENGGKMTQADIATVAGVTVRTVRAIVSDHKMPVPDSSRKISATPMGGSDIEGPVSAPNGPDEDYDPALFAGGKAPQKPESGDEAQKKAKTLAHAYRDKLARAICDYHELKPNRSQRDRLVKLVQGVQLW